MLEYDLLKAERLKTALTYLDKYEKIKPIAGGTDLLVEINNEDIDNSELNYVLDISNINELKKIENEDDYLEIGALASHTKLIESDYIKENYSVIVQAAQTIGSTQIRNRGTIGGNIVNASPAADLLSPLIALKAEVIIQSKNDQRNLQLNEFVTGPYRTDIKSNEMLTKIKIPKYEDEYFSNFQKIGRRQAVAISRLNTAVVAMIDEKNNFYDTRVVPGSATPSPKAFSKVEETVNGQNIDDIDFEEIGEIAANEMVSITGERWSTPYKKPAIATIVKRALKDVVKEVKQHE
ncbi:FAD binding domain-containing protein [Sporohalobacter salinus]|uniref:FAD binding domain-containing protein n=1 Tax=Sporohalobacter salinus TaxID=1494606 RepID=UPI0019603179|nr:xanthine dehydrogenase family protein subunit M [Sporohalobacter salinus]MBM7622492.1 carbon-monoxide dehydrogenase medium subunit/xanthine dehydrogenase FAD-binding subunit [Sporohalobacter salinus]